MNLILGGDPNAGLPTGAGAGAPRQGGAAGGGGQGANPPGTIRVS